MKKTLSVLLAAVLCFTALTAFAGNEKTAGEMSIIEMLLNKKEIIAQKHTGEKSGYSWHETDEYRLEDTKIIEKPADRDLVILNLADIHFSDFGYRFFLNPVTQAEIKKMVNSVKPDLITLSGDIVCSDSTVKSVERITALMDSFKTPWAPVFGNHDDEGNCDQNYLCEEMMKSSYCLMSKGDPEMGEGNYIISITENGRLVETLVMMDSHHNQPNEKQQAWFRWAAKGTAKLSDGKAEVSALMHIPLPEYKYAQDEFHNGIKWADECDGYGQIGEKICCERDSDGNAVQRGFFDMLLETGNTSFVFCSHDHLNDFSVNYKGIRLTYCMKIGFASGFRPDFNGGTVISVGSDGINRITHKTIGLFGVKNVEDIAV